MQPNHGPGPNQPRRGSRGPCQRRIQPFARPPTPYVYRDDPTEDGQAAEAPQQFSPPPHAPFRLAPQFDPSNQPPPNADSYYSPATVDPSNVPPPCTPPAGQICCIDQQQQQSYFNASSSVYCIREPDAQQSEYVMDHPVSLARRGFIERPMVGSSNGYLPSTDASTSNENSPEFVLRSPSVVLEDAQQSQYVMDNPYPLRVWKLTQSAPSRMGWMDPNRRDVPCTPILYPQDQSPSQSMASPFYSPSSAGSSGYSPSIDGSTSSDESSPEVVRTSPDAQPSEYVMDHPIPMPRRGLTERPMIPLIKSPVVICTPVRWEAEYQTPYNGPGRAQGSYVPSPWTSGIIRNPIQREPIPDDEVRGPHCRSLFQLPEQRKRSWTNMRELKDGPDNMVELVMPVIVVTKQTTNIDRESGKITLLTYTFVASNHGSEDIDSFLNKIQEKLLVINCNEANRDGKRVREETSFKVWVGMAALLIERITVLDKAVPGKPFSSSDKDAHSFCIRGKMYWFDQKGTNYAKMEYPVSIIASNSTVHNGDEIRKSEEITITCQKSEKDHKPEFSMTCDQNEIIPSTGGVMKFREEVNCAPYSHLHIKRETTLTLSQQPLVCTFFEHKRNYSHVKPAVDNLPSLLQNNKTRPDAVTTMRLRSPFDKNERHVHIDDEKAIREIDGASESNRDASSVADVPSLPYVTSPKDSPKRKTGYSIRPLSADTSAGSSERDPRLANGGLSPSGSKSPYSTTARSYNTASPFSRARSPRCVLRPEQKNNRRSKSLPTTPGRNISRDTSASPAANRQRNAMLPADPPRRAVIPVSRSQCIRKGGPSNLSLIDDPEKYDRSEITTKKLQLDAVINDKEWEFQLDFHLKTIPGQPVDFDPRRLRIDQNTLWEKVQKSPARSPASRSSTSSTTSSRKSNRSTRTAREASRREKK